MKSLIVGLSLLGAIAGMAGAQTAAAPFAENTVYCFEIGGHEGDNFQHLKLAIGARQAPQPYSILPAHAVVLGQLDGVRYTNQYAGTAMELVPEASASGAPRVAVGLTGNGVGTNPEGVPEIWMFHYNLDLDPATLTGTIYGVEMQSDGMKDVQPIGTVANTALVRPVTPMSCETEF